MSLGENIYKLRTGKRMSQEDFAAAMEVSRQSVSKWENDMAVPELEKLIKMAKLFEVSLDELVGNTPPQPVPEPAPATVPISIPTQRIRTEEIISIVLLVLAVITPLVMVLFREWSYMPLQISLFFMPPATTIISAHLVSKNKWIFYSYLFYHAFLSIMLLSSVWGGFWLSLLNWGSILYWYIKRK